MKVHIICPVRLGESQEAIKYVRYLESQGCQVHYPPRDADQSDKDGFSICSTHLKSLHEADEVHVFYDACSQGIHFDLGMAFALQKPVRLINVIRESNPLYPDSSGGKSYIRMIKVWEKEDA